MADSIDVNENFEANEDELAILPTSVAQGYLYEPRVQQSEPLSDDYSDDESDGESDNGEIPVESERVGNTDWYALVKLSVKPKGLYKLFFLILYGTNQVLVRV